MSDGSHDHRSNDSRRNGSQHIVAVHFAPFIASWRRVKVIVPIIDPLTTVPVFVADVSAPSPVLVVDIVLVMVLVVVLMVVLVVVMMVVMLSECKSACEHESGESGNSYGVPNEFQAIS